MCWMYTNDFSDTRKAQCLREFVMNEIPCHPKPSGLIPFEPCGLSCSFNQHFKDESLDRKRCNTIHDRELPVDAQAEASE
jgi:hypothetical protein